MSISRMNNKVQLALKIRIIIESKVFRHFFKIKKSTNRTKFMLVKSCILTTGTLDCLDWYLWSLDISNHKQFNVANKISL